MIYLIYLIILLLLLLFETNFRVFFKCKTNFENINCSFLLN
eukprot:UN09495